MAAQRRGDGVIRDETEPPSGLPDEAQDDDVPLGIPADEDDEVDRELPGFPEGDIDTAG